MEVEERLKPSDSEAIYDETPSAMCDGIYESSGSGLHHNLNSLIFSQGVKEMSMLVNAAGGREETAFDLAGLGDLYVTCQSGRNRRYGELVGRGTKAGVAYQKMVEEGEIAEGYHALRYGIEWVETLDDRLMGELSLLRALSEIVLHGDDPLDSLTGFLKRQGA